MAVAMNWPKRAKESSEALLVAVMMMRFSPSLEMALMKGALEAVALMIAMGRFASSLSNRDARSRAVMSSPRRLNLASRPSKVPWPIRVIQSGSGVSEVAAFVMACSRAWRSVVGLRMVSS